MNYEELQLDLRSCHDGNNADLAGRAAGVQLSAPVWADPGMGIRGNEFRSLPGPCAHRWTPKTSSACAYSKSGVAKCRQGWRVRNWGIYCSIDAVHWVRLYRTLRTHLLPLNIHPLGFIAHSHVLRPSCLEQSPAHTLLLLFRHMVHILRWPSPAICTWQSMGTRKPILGFRLFCPPLAGTFVRFFQTGGSPDPCIQFPPAWLLQPYLV